MCRYATKAYKPHYACFECRKTFKRRLMWDINGDDKRTVEAKCPQCGALMADMGLDFESPKKDDLKAWAHIKSLYSVGITFHSCGCGGPGYIPRTHESLIAHFEELLSKFNQNLEFWRQRVEPSNEKERNREISKHGESLDQVRHLNSKKWGINTEEAKKHWFERISEVQQKIKQLKTAS